MCPDGLPLRLLPRAYSDNTIYRTAVGSARMQ